jgi:hypothetical protein
MLKEIEELVDAVEALYQKHEALRRVSPNAECYVRLSPCEVPMPASEIGKSEQRRYERHVLKAAALAKLTEAEKDVLGLRV